jgi:hypothetical protein
MRKSPGPEQRIQANRECICSHRHGQDQRIRSSSCTRVSVFVSRYLTMTAHCKESPLAVHDGEVSSKKFSFLWCIRSLHLRSPTIRAPAGIPRLEERLNRLTAVMQKTLARGKSPRERLQLCGCGYVSFALRWPQHFLVMFDLPQLCASTARNRVSAKMRFVFCSTALPAHSHCLSEIGVVWGAGHNQRRAKPSAACPLRKGTDKQHHTCLRPNSSKWSIRKALISTIPTQ